MQATYLAFSVIYLLGSRAMGVKVSRDEAHALVHLWRYVGWLMGVDERWLVTSENDGRIALYQYLLSQAGPDESSRRLGAALGDEPLERHYPNAAWIRGRWNRAKHLSTVRVFLGARGMASLGLPTNVLPWYPLLTAPPRFVFHRALRLLPSGRALLSRGGLAAQERYLATLTGGEPVDSGTPASMRAA